MNIVQILQAILLGIVQGLAEFLPISSSGHLLIVPWLLGWSDDTFINSLPFDIALHLGTLLAVISFFWRDFLRLAIAWLGSLRQLIPTNAAASGIVAGARMPFSFSNDARMAWMILIGTIPGAVVGLLLESKIEELFHEAANLRWSILLIAAFQVIFAVLLLLSDRHGTQGRTAGEMNWMDAISIGMMQALAIFPGVSRSGSTITAGLYRGLDRYTATRYSFMLSSPIIIGAGIKAALDLRKTAVPSDELIAMAAGMLAAAIVGYLVIGWLLSVVQRIGMRWFVYYRYAIAAVIVLKVLIMGV